RHCRARRAVARSAAVEQGNLRVAAARAAPARRGRRAAVALVGDASGLTGARISLALERLRQVALRLVHAFLLPVLLPLGLARAPRRVSPQVLRLGGRNDQIQDDEARGRRHAYAAASPTSSLAMKPPDWWRQSFS